MDHERLRRLSEDLGDTAAAAALYRVDARRGRHGRPLWMRLDLEDPAAYMRHTGGGYTTRMCLQILEYIMFDEGQDAIIVAHTQAYAHALRQRVKEWLQRVCPEDLGRSWRIVGCSWRSLARYMYGRQGRDVVVFVDNSVPRKELDCFRPWS